MKRPLALVVVVAALVAVAATAFAASQTGTKDGDKLRGTEQADTIDGGAGDDYIAGLGGDDTLQGGADSDSIDGGAGNDKVYGGGAEYGDAGLGRGSRCRCPERTTARPLPMTSRRRSGTAVQAPFARVARGGGAHPAA